jgi:tRNA(fMet)-specific endonuclease VapC
MPFVVVDTCVVSYLYKDIPLAEAYRDRIAGNDKAISFMTFAELYYGTLKRNWGNRKRNELMEHVARDYTLFPFNRRLCVKWAEVRNQTRLVGRKIRTGDSWIAATAMLYDLPLVTHNHKHFKVLEPDLSVISESPDS